MGNLEVWVEKIDWNAHHIDVYEVAQLFLCDMVLWLVHVPSGILIVTENKLYSETYHKDYVLINTELWREFFT
jgi:hypothetical protein